MVATDQLIPSVNGRNVPDRRRGRGQRQRGVVAGRGDGYLRLEIDPDPELEREAEETAQRVMQGSELGIQRMEGRVHVQRSVYGENPYGEEHQQFIEQQKEHWGIDEADTVEETFDFEELKSTAAESTWTTSKGLLALLQPEFAPAVVILDIGETVLREFWDRTDGSPEERLQQVTQLVTDQHDTGQKVEGVAKSQRDGPSGQSKS